MGINYFMVNMHLNVFCVIHITWKSMFLSPDNHVPRSQDTGVIFSGFPLAVGIFAIFEKIIID